MAEALVKFFIQRLDSLLLQQKEAFTGLEDRIEWIASQLKEIAEFLGNNRTAEGDPAFCSCTNDLSHLVHEIDDQVDEFIIEMDRKNGSDKLRLTDCFRDELRRIGSRLAEYIQRIAEFNSSSPVQEDKMEKEDVEEQNHSEGQTETSNSNIIGEEPTQVDAESNEKQGDQMSASSSSGPFRSKYTDLPYYLQSCLMYCCLFPENYWINKGKLIRLLVAEGLTQEKAGQILEDVAEENISELVSHGMLQVNDKHPGDGTKFTVSPPYRMFLRENFVTAHADSDSTFPHTARRVLTSDVAQIVKNLSNLRPRSLFLLGNQNHSEGDWLNFMGAKFLRVLDLEDTRIKSLPEQVGDLIHLTYLGLKRTDISDLPARLGNLGALQTLDIRWCGYLKTLSTELLNLARLRHLKMFKNFGVSGMKLPGGISKFNYLLTLTGVLADDNTAGELGDLCQLRRLGVMDVTEEDASELFGSIMKMQGLLSLSLEAKHTFNHEYLVLLETFSPPPLLRKLRLEGRLAKIPNWLGSMESLTKLRLGFSHLSESPTIVLQLLPNLKNLTLWQACDARQLGKEFCKPGGFPKLEVLSMASGVLEEWTELEEGALPSLQYLHLHNCLKLRMLPEGLQFLTTLKQLDLLPLLDDHAERLKPDGGEENYKIRNIPKISFIPTSVVRRLVSTPPHPAALCTEE